MAKRHTIASDERHQQAENVVAFVPGLPRESKKLLALRATEDPDRSSKRSRAVFFAIDSIFKATVGDDRKACGKAMQTADTRLAVSESEQNADVEDLRLILRVRCSLCPTRCKQRLD